ncbi:peptide ABC transporter substrate-binding protein [Paenibacillus turpanensis]|uniref:peptide ABC transporter substrate-binding protein n=1 Tax=Paenibacillus turpanensis TaxID=2689078 RepID=UPI00140A28E9|nr:peptide ABC transporter substrate-binding protein [Paenibacillus turpanensis]
MRMGKLLFYWLPLVAVAIAAVFSFYGQAGEGSGSIRSVFRLNVGEDPVTLDPAAAQDISSVTVINHVMEGLTREEGDTGKYVPAVAERWTVSEDGLTYTFTLRESAKWSNGDPVKAGDFVYAWQRALAPERQKQSPYAYQFFYLKNAKAYHEGAIADFNEVGVKAVDERTLELTLQYPAPFMDALVSQTTFFPVHSASVRAEGFQGFTTGTGLITNGPFQLTEWKSKERIVLKKNETYYDAGEIRFSEAHLSMVPDGKQELSLFASGKLDWAGRPYREFMPGELGTLQPSLKSKGIGSVYYLAVNALEPPFNQPAIRMALSMTLSRSELLQRAGLTEQREALGFVPEGIRGAEGAAGDFRSQAGAAVPAQHTEEARRLLAEGLKQAGMSELPEIRFVINQNEDHQRIAEAAAAMWKESLGVRVKIEPLAWDAFLSTMEFGNYHVARGGWAAEFNDPLAFLSMWSTSSANNTSGWRNEQYNNLIKEAYTLKESEKRMQAMFAAEKLLVEEAVVIPIYYYSGSWLQHPGLREVYLDYKGDIHFDRGYIE